MTINEAIQAANDASNEGLKGKYPMAAIVLEQELQYQRAKNFCLTPEVGRAQDRCRQLMNALVAIRDYYRGDERNGDTIREIKRMAANAINPPNS